MNMKLCLKLEKSAKIRGMLKWQAMTLKSVCKWNEIFMSVRHEQRIKTTKCTCKGFFYVIILGIYVERNTQLLVRESLALSIAL